MKVSVRRRGLYQQNVLSFDSLQEEIDYFAAQPTPRKGIEAFIAACVARALEGGPHAPELRGMASVLQSMMDTNDAWRIAEAAVNLGMAWERANTTERLERPVEAYRKQRVTNAKNNAGKEMSPDERDTIVAAFAKTPEGAPKSHRYDAVADKLRVRPSRVRYVIEGPRKTSKRGKPRRKKKT